MSYNDFMNIISIDQSQIINNINNTIKYIKIDAKKYKKYTSKRKVKKFIKITYILLNN